MLSTQMQRIPYRRCRNISGWIGHHVRTTLAHFRMVANDVGAKTPVKAAAALAVA
jgi:hypothetical protein